MGGALGWRDEDPRIPESLHMCLHTFIYVCVYIYIYIYVYVYTYVCIYTYTHIHLRTPLIQEYCIESSNV